MTSSSHPLPPLASDLEIAEFDDQIVALVTQQRRAVLLESGPALVLDSCRQRHERHALVTELAQATGSTHEQTSDWLDATLVELSRLGIIDNRQ